MFWVKAAFVAGPGLTALLRSRLGFRQFHPGDSYPAVEADPEIQRGRKNPSRERKRAVSIALATLPLSVRIPRANIAARFEAVALRVGLRASARARELARGSMQVVQPHAVVPQELAPDLVTQRHRQELVHGVRELAVRMRVVGGE